MLPAFFRLALKPAASLCGINALATLERGQASTKFLVERCELCSPSLFMFFQKPECFPNNLACGVVAARLYLGADELL